MNNQSETNTTLENRGGASSGKRTGVIISTVVLFIVFIVLTALITFSYTVDKYGRVTNENTIKLQTITDLLEKNAYYSPQEKEMFDAAVKAYVGASGDKYTVYYNGEEYRTLTEENNGRYVGIGVTVSEASVRYLGQDIGVLEVVRMVEGSPAEESGLSIGDYIYAVDTEDGMRHIDEIGQDVAIEYIRGEAGTKVHVYWLTEDEDGYVIKDSEFIRSEVVTVSVAAKKAQTASNVGIVSIYQFDLTTPTQLCGAIDRFRDEGIQNIVLDLRDNGGGDLLSVVACACYFLEDDDLIITAESKNGEVERHTATEKSYGGIYEGCSVKKEDIGKYRDLKVVVLVNGNTASAAELLTAVFRDYRLASIVGTQTFGKGSMQTLIPLAPFGIEGGIKMTTHLYYPPSGEGYNGVGITPDVIVEPPDDSLDSAIGEEQDMQLMVAIRKLVENY